MARRVVLLAIVLTAVVATLMLLLPAGLRGHKLQLTTHFRDGQGLTAGAPVRVAGVDVGRVSSVRVRPELREQPVEVVLNVSTSYKLQIPADATVSLLSGGILGPTYLEIDMIRASGMPIASGGVLKGVDAESISTRELLDKVSELTKQLARCSGKGEGGERSKKTGSRRTP